MKKALIIANMIFASATVWGMENPATELDLNSRSYYSQREDILRSKYIENFDELINDWRNNNSDKVLNDLVKDYMKHGVSDEYGNNLLMRACQLRKYDLVSRVLEYYQEGVPLTNSVNAWGDILLTVLENARNTLLHGSESVSESFVLAYQEDLTIAESLVNVGVDVNTISSESIFLFFGRNKPITMMHWLIDHGLNINQKRRTDDVTFLHIAAMLNSSTVAQNLLEKGSEIDSQNKYGETPLHWAVQWRKVHTVRYLVQHGADINITDEKGESPLSLAQRLNNTTILDALYDDGDTLVNFGEEPEFI